MSGKGTPTRLKDGRDLTQPGITMVNREKGSGVRVLIDENLRLEGISRNNMT